MNKPLLFTALGILAGSLPAIARDFTYTHEGQTLTYTVLDESARTVETKSGDSDSGNDVSGALVIPSVVKDGDIEYTVVAIGENSFRACSELSSIEIPNSVTDIQNRAFSFCKGLTSVRIPDSVTNLGPYAFYSCSGLTSIELSNSLQSLYEFVFANCGSLVSVKIPDSVTFIGEMAFYKCSSLTSVEIPKYVTAIGPRAFSLCSSLTSVEIPKSIQYLYSEVFAGCRNLQSVYYNASAPLAADKDIFDQTTYKKGTLYTNDKAIEKCKDIEPWKNFATISPIVCHEFTYTYEGQTLTYTVLNESARTVETKSGYRDDNNDIIAGNYAEGALIIPAVVSDGETEYSVTAIGDYAFYYRSGLTSVTIPGSVTEIGEDSFHWCYNLASLKIFDSVKRIGDRAFQLCQKLTSVEIPATVTSIGNYAFCDCTALTAVYYEAPKPVKAPGDVFSYTTYANATLYTLEEMIETYRQINPWSRFHEISTRASGIEAVEADAAAQTPAAVSYWNTQGIRSATPHRGLNIVRRSDGTVSKEMH